MFLLQVQVGIIVSWLISSHIMLGSSFKTTYIIPTHPMVASSANCPAGASRFLTLNDFIDGGSMWSSTLESGERVVFRSGVHLVNGTQNQYLFTSGVSDVVLMGESNVSVVCIEKLILVFHDIDSITLSNIHFDECKGSYDLSNFDKTSTLLFVDVTHNVLIDAIKITNNGGIGIAMIFEFNLFHAPWLQFGIFNSSISTSTLLFVDVTHNVLIDAIKITNNGGIGIAMIFEFNLFHAPWLQFGIFNSSISTGDIGVYSGGTHEMETNIDDGSIQIEISNVSFKGSCLQFETISFVSYVIRKMRFAKCRCSPILLFNGVLTTITLQDITVTDNESPLVMHVSQAKHVTFRGMSYFLRNKGVSIINGSKVEFSGAKVHFINNTVLSKTDIPGTTMFIRNSSIVVLWSTLNFIGNYGQSCGGIIASDKTVLIFSQFTNVMFIRNTGDKGGALSLYKESTIQLFSPEVHINITFHNNTANKGGAIYVEDVNHVKTFSFELTKSVIEIVNKDTAC